MVNLLKKERPDLLILIDAQGFNVPLAKRARKLGIKTCYYIAPQEWLWGTEKNARIVAQTLDKIIAIFEEEYQSYRALGANVVYHGHPLLDIVKPTLSKEEALKRFELNAAKPIVALCPGSRRQEFKTLLPILLQAGEKLKGQFPELQFAIPLASPKFRELLEKILRLSPLKVKIIEGYTYDVLTLSKVALAVSGTIVLESIILGAPVVMIYKLSRLTEFIGRKILGFKLSYFSLPNLLAREKIVPELVQEDCTPEKIFAEAASMLLNPEKQTRRFPAVLKKLGQPGAIRKAAEEILKM